MSRIRFSLLCVLSAIALNSCAGNRHLRFANGNEQAPRYLELSDEHSIATFHFPAGLYSLDLIDDEGWYYRALGRVMKHSFAGSTRQDAGIFVGRKSREIRAYVTWAGGRTKIGNLSHARITFRNQRSHPTTR